MRQQGGVRVTVPPPDSVWEDEPWTCEELEPIAGEGELVAGQVVVSTRVDGCAVVLDRASGRRVKIHFPTAAVARAA